MTTRNSLTLLSALAALSVSISWKQPEAAGGQPALDGRIGVIVDWSGADAQTGDCTGDGLVTADDIAPSIPLCLDSSLE